MSLGIRGHRPADIQCPDWFMGHSGTRLNTVSPLAWNRRIHFTFSHSITYISCEK
jgi:hypothetical protein